MTKYKTAHIRHTAAHLKTKKTPKPKMAEVRARKTAKINRRTMEMKEPKWHLISNVPPPSLVWLEFYDGDKTMSDEGLNHIDFIRKDGTALSCYLHNYTHWRRLTKPDYVKTTREKTNG